MSEMTFPLPEPNAPLPGPAASREVQTFLSQRRSTPIKTFTGEGRGPDPDELDNLILSAMRVPDHRKLGPWRAITFTGDTRDQFGLILADRFSDLNPGALPEAIEEEKARLTRAPVVVTIVSSPVDDGKTPVWEQELSSGALCLNLLYMAHASGYAATWLSEWWAFDADINAALGLKDHERIAGNIFIGRSDTPLFERPRPDLTSRISAWKA